MTRHIAKVTTLVLLSLIAIAVIVGAGFYWRLSQGPISIDFLSTRIETAVNRQLQGMSIKLGGAILELDKKSSVPRLRFRDLILRGPDDNTIAQAARAAVDLDSGQLLRGAIVATSLELIGPSVRAKRNLDGRFEFGISSPIAAEGEVFVIDDIDQSASDGKTDMSALPDDSASNTSSTKLLELITGTGSGSSISTLEAIRITEAQVDLYDEANDSNWSAPNADMTFRKMPYGFVVFAKADVATRTVPWRTEISATYRAATKSFSVSTRIYDFVPASVADKVYALNQLARMNIPLSGQAEFELDSAGKLTSAAAELIASPGVLNLPEYIAQPLIVDEGTLRLQYDPATGGFNISDSSLLISGTKAELMGEIAPIREVDGKLTAISINLKARNVGVDPQEGTAKAVNIDRIEFVGKAAIDEAKLNIDDLVIMSGNAGVRLRGIITGGDESAGLNLAGRLRDVSADLLRKLWPPIIAQKSRDWVTNNVISGRISDGTFTINLAVNELAEATRNQQLKNETIDFQFKMEDVSTRYFKKLPPLINGSGSAHLRGSEFDLTIASGKVALDGGQSLVLNSGKFRATDLLSPAVPGEFVFDVSGDVQSLLAYANLPDLNLIKTDMEKTARISGKANAIIGLKFPLIKNVPRELVAVTTKLKLSETAIKNVGPNINLTDGKFEVAVSKAGLLVTGPAKLNGVPADIQWERASGTGKQKAIVETVLDEADREALKIKLSDYMSGPVPVKAIFDSIAEGGGPFKVVANLSGVALRLKAMSYARPATEDTKAEFTVTPTAKSGLVINDFVVRGPNLELRGDLEIAKGGVLQVINLSNVSVDEETSFAVRLEPRDGGYDVSLTGKSFDARPYIKTLTAPAKPNGVPTKSTNQTKLVINARFNRVYGYQGEIIEDVSAAVITKGGAIASADVNGKFLSGQPISVRVIPNAQGREVRLTSSDGGAVLRAVNIYAKVAGGQFEFIANLSNDITSSLRDGQMNIRNFDVRNEAALAELDEKGKAKKSGPRKSGINFRRISLPFSADEKYIRIGSTFLRGNDLGARAEGIIRKSDGALDITGTIIPAYALNSAIGDIPLLGDILTGGNDEGIFGITFAMGGTMAKPKFQMNPISALAPGILRKFFEFGNNGQTSPDKRRKSDK